VKGKGGVNERGEKEFPPCSMGIEGGAGRWSPSLSPPPAGLGVWDT
jgi:hypothetical protein